VAKISIAEKALGKTLFCFEFMRKGFLYSMVAYQVLDNWYDAVLFRGGMIKNCSLKVRTNATAAKAGALARMLAGVHLDAYRDHRIRMRYNGKTVYFEYGDSEQLATTLSGINEQFAQKQYQKLDVKNKTIVDIGASTGDSAIYFALRGAKKVIGFEPYPFAYNAAVKNVEANRLGGKIVLVNEACLARRGTLIMDPSFKSNDRDSIREFKKGVRINAVTIEDIVKKYRLKGAVLKIDCEGYEYELINDCKTSVLREFGQVAIEYHFGFRDLKAALEKAGFEVRHTIPLYAKDIDNKKNALYGLLFAKKKKEKRSATRTEA